MANFFSQFTNYSQEGPGVNKDDDDKNAFALFFTIYLRKFWSLVRLNMLYFLFSVPSLIISIYLFSRLYIQVFWGTSFMYDLIESPTRSLFFCIMTATAFILTNTIVLGPATAGFTNVLKKFTAGDQAFVWYDFRKCAASNFKQSIIISAIDFFTVLVVGIDIWLFTGNIIQQIETPMITNIISVLFIVASIIYLMMHIYIYPMLITFNMSVKDIYKNALLFSFAKFVPNLLIMTACLAVFIVSYIYTLAGFILFPLITMSTVGFISNYYVFRQLKKYGEDKNEIIKENAFTD